MLTAVIPANFRARVRAPYFPRVEVMQFCDALLMSTAMENDPPWRG